MLLGYVDASPLSDPEQLHFTQLSYDLRGNYTCEVSTLGNNVAEATYTLRVLGN